MLGDNASRWLDRTLTEAAQAIRSGQVTSTALVEASLERIAMWQPHINCFLSLETDEARAAARAADQQLAHGGPVGPLHGVPLAHKDIFSRGGDIVTAGSSILRSWRPEPTATVLQRLQNAGAVSMGTLNLSEFAAYSTGENKHFGDCRNPWDPTRIAGGSSSGSAAAVAARLIFGALGTDTGGSNRTPQALCGVTGLKPTYGLISRYGVFPRAWSLDTVGITARTAADIALILSLITGSDPRDPSASSVAPPDYQAKLHSYQATRIGVVEGPMRNHASKEVDAGLSQSLRVFVELGYKSASVEFIDFDDIARLGDVLMKSEAAAIHGRWMNETPQAYSMPVFSRIEAGFYIPAERYAKALAIRGAVLADFASRAFKSADVLCLPVVPTTAPRFSDIHVEEPSQIAERVGGLTRYSRPFNYLGLPALVLPCGMSADGLPIALQLIGKPFSEARLLALAHSYQRVTSWHDRAPLSPVQVDAKPNNRLGTSAQAS